MSPAVLQFSDGTSLNNPEVKDLTENEETVLKGDVESGKLKDYDKLAKQFLDGMPKGDPMDAEYMKKVDEYAKEFNKKHGLKTETKDDLSSNNVVEEIQKQLVAEVDEADRDEETNYMEKVPEEFREDQDMIDLIAKRGSILKKFPTEADLYESYVAVNVFKGDDEHEDKGESKDPYSLDDNQSKESTNSGPDLPTNNLSEPTESKKRHGEVYDS